MKELFFISLVLVLVVSCKPEGYDDLKAETYQADSVYTAERVIITDEIKPTIPKRLWDGKNIKLPSGRVISMDFQHLPKNGKNYHDNYVVIKNADSLLTIYRDIDIDTYLALQIGDLIKNN